MEHNAEPLTCRKVALALHQAGLTPVPTRPGEERVAIDDVDFARHLPTEEEIGAWYDVGPDRGVALLLGRSTLVIVVDPRRGGDVGAFRGTTPVAQSTSRGRWYFFYSATRGVEVPAAADLGPGIELRARGSLVVVAPTRLAGEAYRWEGGAQGALLRWQLPECTEVVAVQELLAGRAPTAPAWRAGADAEAAAGAPAGDADARPAVRGPSSEVSDPTLAQLAESLGETGVPFDTVISCLRGIAERLHCELHHGSAASAPVEDVEWSAVDVPRREAIEDRREGGDPQRDDDALVARVVAACQPAGALVDAGGASVEWAIPEVLAHGALHDLHGAPKAGMSTLISWCVRALVRGEPFLGAPVRRTDVVWITGQHATLAPMLERAGISRSPHVHVLRHGDLAGVPWRLVARAALEVASAHGARVLVVDPFERIAGLRGGGDDAAGEVYAALDALQPALAAGLAVVLVRHDRRADAGVVDSSDPIAGEADVIHQLARVDGDETGAARRLLTAGRLSELMPAARVVVLDAGAGYRVAPPVGPVQPEDTATADPLPAEPARSGTPEPAAARPDPDPVTPDPEASDRDASERDASEPEAAPMPPRWHEIADRLPPLRRTEDGGVSGITVTSLARAAHISARSVREMLEAVKRAELSDSPPDELAWAEEIVRGRKITYYGRPG